MKNSKKELLKDLIIDHIYHHSYNELVKRVESGNWDYSVPAEAELKNDPVFKDIYDSAMSSGIPIKMYYAPRDLEYCYINEDSRSFTVILESSGIEQNEEFESELQLALEYLIHRSFIKRSQPIESKYALTPKGLHHYASGQSFEARYSEGKNARNALNWSIASITVAALTWVGTYGREFISFIVALT